MAIAKFSLVALDCPDPKALATFYAAIVGGNIKESTASPDWVRLEVPGSSDIGFQQALNYEPPGWPDGLPQQAHLDFDVPDLDAGERAVVEAGAVKAEVQPEPEMWRVFLDPVGHPFCLCLVPVESD